MSKNKDAESAPVSASPDVDVESVSKQALLTAQLLQRLVRARRFYLDDFLDGDGPYWTSIGLFIDGESNTVTTFDRALSFADESIETGRFILQQLIDREVVQQYRTRQGVNAYRLTPQFSGQFAIYLQEQLKIVRRACAQV